MSTNPYPYKDLPVNPFYMDLAKQGYEHYGAAVDFKNFQGNPLPTFDSLHEAGKKGWHDMARWAYNQGQAAQTNKTA